MTCIVFVRVVRPYRPEHEVSYYGRGATAGEMLADVSRQATAEYPDAVYLVPVKVIPVQGQCPNYNPRSVWDRLGLLAKGVG